MGSAGEGIIKRNNLYFIDPKKIVRKQGWNPRFDFGDIESLARSIKENGILNPILVKRDDSGNFELINGDRRFTAIELLMKKGEVFKGGIPAIIESKAINEISALLKMFESNSGKPFLPLEEAAAYKRMRDAGMSIASICKAVSKTTPHVTSTLALLCADESLQEAVKEKKITVTDARAIAVKAKGKKDKQKELVKKSTSSKAGKKEVQKELANMNKKSPTIVKTLTKKQLEEKLDELNQNLSELLEAAGLKRRQLYMYVKESKYGEVIMVFGVLQGIKMALGEK